MSVFDRVLRLLFATLNLIINFITGDVLEVLEEENHTDQPSTPASAAVNSNDEELSRRPKKRKINRENWKCSIRKKQRNTGQEYTSSSGVLMPARAFTNNPCNCKRKCHVIIQNHQRRSLFEGFWKLGNYFQQNVFIRGLVRIQDVKRKRVRDGSHSEKQHTFQYYF